MFKISGSCPLWTPVIRISWSCPVWTPVFKISGSCPVWTTVFRISWSCPVWTPVFKISGSCPVWTTVFRISGSCPEPGIYIVEILEDSITAMDGRIRPLGTQTIHFNSSSSDLYIRLNTLIFLMENLQHFNSCLRIPKNGRTYNH